MRVHEVKLVVEDTSGVGEIHFFRSILRILCFVPRCINGLFKGRSLWEDFLVWGLVWPYLPQEWTVENF